jgi:hypothetical protein
VSGGACNSFNNFLDWTILSCPSGATKAVATAVTSGGTRFYGLWPNGLGAFDYQLGECPTTLGSGGIFRYPTGTKLTAEQGSWDTDFTSGHIFFADDSNSNLLDEIVPGAAADGGSDGRTCVESGVTTLADWGAAAGFAYTVDGTANTVQKYADDAIGFTYCGAGTIVASGVSSETVFAADVNGTSFYFADANGIHACTTSGTGCQTLATGQGSVTELVYDTNNLYWIGSAGLVECAKTGCSSAPHVLAANLPTTNPLDVDVGTTGSVYYASGTTIYRLPK